MASSAAPYHRRGSCFMCRCFVWRPAGVQLALTVSQFQFRRSRTS